MWRELPIRIIAAFGETRAWEKAGGPEVHPPTRSGFGKRLIERTLALELGGNARMQFRPSGLRCTAEVPMP